MSQKRRLGNILRTIILFVVNGYERAYRVANMYRKFNFVQIYLKLSGFLCKLRETVIRAGWVFILSHTIY